MPAETARPVVLVTGASSGIGKAAATRLAAEGFRVFGTSRHHRADAGGVEMVTMDVRDVDSVDRCVREVLDRAGRIDILINNAGTVHHGFAEETSRPEVDAVLETNLFGAARVCHAVLPEMRRRRHGRIVNVGSLAAWIGEPGEGFYAASKAALARYTEALRHEVWHLGIAVSLLEPGAFRTAVLDSGSEADPAIDDYDGPRESARTTLRRGMARGGDPATAADVIVRIVRARRPLARYATGPERWVPLLRVLFPQRLFDAMLRRAFGLPMRSPR